MASSLGMPGVENALNLPRCERAVVLLIDGLGLVPLQQVLAQGDIHAPAIADAVPNGGSLRSPFPSTTPAGLAALGTGLDVGCHGFVGASFVLPETGHVLWPLSWRDDPLPAAVQPEPTVLEQAAAAGIAVSSISPRAFEDSGLTRAVLRGGTYVGADSFGERVGHTARALKGRGPSLVYAYWGDLDKTGHVHGVGSVDWRYELELVDLMVRRILDVVPSGTRVLVTADHGMLDTTPADRIHLDEYRDLRHAVTHIAGEPRVRHVYTKAGAAADVAATWRAVLGDRAQVVLRDDAVARGWFGEVDPVLADRIGDVVVAATGTTVLSSEAIDSRTSALVGQHGSFTDAEMAIPLLQWEA